MRQKTIYLMVLVVFCVSFGSYSEGKTADKTNRWTYYGTLNENQFYFDKSSIKKVSNNIISVWDMLQFKKEITLSPKNDSRTLDSQISLHEIDCSNHMHKLIKFTTYNKDRKIQGNYYSQRPQNHYIMPGSIYQLLEKEVCK